MPEHEEANSDANAPMSEAAADLHERGPVAVAGATGFVGRHVCRALLDAGYRVRALVREIRSVGDRLPDHERLELRQVAGLTPGELGLIARRLDPYAAKVELDDGSARANPLEGCSAVVNCVGIIREASGGQTFRRVHIGVTDGLVRAAKKAGVDRFVQISALGVHPDGPSEYQTSKAAAEKLLMSSGLTWTVLRPSLIHAADANFIDDAKQWARGRSAPFFFMPYFTREADPAQRAAPLPNPLAKQESSSISPVHVADVADAVVRALGDPETTEGEIYNLAGPETLTWPEMLGEIREHTPLSKKLPIVGLPAKLGVLQAKGAKAVGLRDALPFDEGMAMMAAADSTASLVKARAHLGFDPRPFRESFAGYAPQI